MKLSVVISLVFSLSYTSAFPSTSKPLSGRSAKDAAAAGCPYAENLEKRQGAFNPVAQKVSTQGVHAFVAPVAGDQRGPCPGLNALANHGYLAHNGVTNLVECIGALQTVFNFGLDFSTALCALGVVFAGDPVSTKWSIGGPPKLTLIEELTSILTGRPQGLSNTHSSYESDSSAIMGDSYLFNGDTSSLRVEYLKRILDLGGNDFTRKDIWVQFRKDRFEHSIANNPYFFFGPFSGILVSEAGFIFPRVSFANRTAQEPDKGVLTRSTLLSFYGVTETNGELIVNKGYERIPDNWYRARDSFLFPEAVAIVAEIIAQYPRAGSVGGNTGTVNSFTGVDLGSLTGGVFNAGDLTDPAKLQCFLFQVSQILMPTVVQPLFKVLHPALNLLGKWFALFDGLNCPQLAQLDQRLFQKYPGAVPGKFA